MAEKAKERQARQAQQAQQGQAAMEVDTSAAEPASQLAEEEHPPPMCEEDACSGTVGLDKDKDTGKWYCSDCWQRWALDAQADEAEQEQPVCPDPALSRGLLLFTPHRLLLASAASSSSLLTAARLRTRLVRTQSEQQWVTPATHSEQPSEPPCTGGSMERGWS